MHDNPLRHEPYLLESHDSFSYMGHIAHLELMHSSDRQSMLYLKFSPIYGSANHFLSSDPPSNVQYLFGSKHFMSGSLICM